MSQPAESLEPAAPPRLVLATVVGRADDGWSIRLDGCAPTAARRAAGCLLEPMDGDRVLVAEADGRAFILSVLERDGELSRLSLEGDVEVVAPTGRLRVQGRDGIDLGTPGPTRITTGRLEVTAISARVLARQLHALGERAKSEFSKVELVAETVDTIAERFRQRAKRVMRFVEGLDQLRAGHIDTRAEGLARVHAQDQVVTADKLVKVDGKQVHIG